MANEHDFDPLERVVRYLQHLPAHYLPAPRDDDALAIEPAAPDDGKASTGTVKDPVCGMNVDPARAKHTLELDGKAIFFCSAGCVAKVRADPARYHASGADRGRRSPSARSAALTVPLFLLTMTEMLPRRPPGAPTW
jgi:YHS domain-containing protein